MKSSKERQQPSLTAWIIDTNTISSLSTQLLSYLDENEIKRSKEFRSAMLGRQYSISRIVLRQALSNLIGDDPHSWKFVNQEFGKPTLSPSHELPTIDFNISHSGSVLVVAIGVHCQIGVDIEQLHSRFKENRIELQLEDTFTKSELNYIKLLPKEQQTKASLQIWTCKEAYAKLLGLGINQNFQDLELTLNPLPQMCFTKHLSPIKDLYLEHHELKIAAETYSLAIAVRTLQEKIPTVTLRHVHSLTAGII